MATATKRIAYNTGAQTVGKAVITLIGFISIGILTRYLGADGYGLFTTALVFLSLFGIIADLGLFTIAVRDMSRDPRRTQSIVSNMISLRSLLAIAVFGIAIGIGWLLPYPVEVKVAIGIAAIGSFFGLVGTSIASVFQAKLRMDLYVVTDVIGRALALAAVFWVIANNAGFYAIVATAIVAPLATFLLSAVLSRRFIKLRLGFDTGLWKRMLKESIPLGLTLVVGTLYLKLDVMMLSIMRSPAEVGVYGAIYKLVDILITLPGLFMNSVLPILVARLKLGIAQGFDVAQKSFDALLVAGLGLAFGGLVVGEDLMQLIGGPEFVQGALALKITLFAMLFTFIAALYGTVYVVTHHVPAALKLALLGLALNLLFNLFAIPRFGYEGAAVVTVVTEGIISVCYFIGMKRMLGRRLSLAAGARALPAAVVMVAVMLPLAGVWPVAVLVGGTVYVALVIVFRAIHPDIVKELVRR